MATRIRLRRVGRKKLPLYRIVVADQESPRDGRFIEIIGTYNPKGATAAEKVQVDADKARQVDRAGRHAVGHGAVAPQAGRGVQGRAGLMAPAAARHLVVGRLRKPHGLKGDLTLFPLTDDPDAVFAAGPVGVAGGARWQRRWRAR